MLENLSVMFNVPGADECRDRLGDFNETFQSLNEVLKSMFGHRLQSDWRERLEEFRERFVGLGLSVTPKVSFVFILLLLFAFVLSANWHDVITGWS